MPEEVFLRMGTGQHLIISAMLCVTVSKHLDQPFGIYQHINRLLHIYVYGIDAENTTRLKSYYSVNYSDVTGKSKSQVSVSR